MSKALNLTRRGALAGAVAAAACASQARTASPVRAYPRMQPLIDGFVADGKVAGVCVAIGTATAPPAFLSAGRTAFSTDTPADPDTLWRIYSMTKPVTAAAGLALIEDGVLTLDQPVADILPAFTDMRVATSFEPLETRPAVRQMTIRHLLTHTSGLSYVINGDGPMQRLYRAHGIQPYGAQILLAPGDAPTPETLEEFGERLAALPLLDDPGARWEYSISLDLLGLVIQRASGMPFETYLRRRLLAPLDMTDTDFAVPEAKRARLSGNYQVTPEGLRTIDEPQTSAWVDVHPMPAGGAGLVSSARDYAKFCKAMLAGGAGVLAPETVAMARSNLLPDTAAPMGGYMVGQAFGAGVGVVTAESAMPGGEPPGSYSWSGAAGTTMWIDPRNGIYVVAMTQFLPSSAYPFWSATRAAFYADLAAAG
ncbi:MAG: serine hydrolase [Alphaproteobacteria bacterium]|nr:serine hydrolase [Alphaproteobacteria bacterium]